MIHGTFSVERDLAAPVDKVWAAYADPAVRSRWHRIPGRDSHHTLRFRPGGTERLHGTFSPSGRPELIEESTRFIDIVESERIVAAYDLALDGVRRWTSLLTLSFAATEVGTRLIHTEQYVMLAWSGDGAHDIAHLKGSVQLAHNALAAVVED